MKFCKLHAACNELILNLLKENGFEYRANGAYVRADTTGMDVVIVDLDRSGSRFAVIMCYYPQYLEILFEMHDLKDVTDRGYPVPSFLTPGAIVSDAKTWPCENEQKLRRSLEQVRIALERIGLPWLGKLRKPEFYATKVDQVAAFGAALVFEEAGNYLKAKELYKEMLRRFEACLSTGAPNIAERFFTENPGNGKEFIYVAHKLGVVDDFCKRLMEIHNYHPDFQPLSEGS